MKTSGVFYVGIRLEQLLISLKNRPGLVLRPEKALGCIVETAGIMTPFWVPYDCFVGKGMHVRKKPAGLLNRRG